MKEITVQIDGMMSNFDGAKKRFKRRDDVVRVDANFLSGTATIGYDKTRFTPDDIHRFIFGMNTCGRGFRQRPLKASRCAVAQG